MKNPSKSPFRKGRLFIRNNTEKIIEGKAQWLVAETNLAFEINIPADIPDSHRICFNGSIFDSHDRFWKIRNLPNLNVVPFGFEPEEIIPEHIAGMGDAEFRIRIFNPPLLKKHTYTISVCDSINLNGDIGFNLVDENEGDTLLHAHEKPDQFAYNIPVTDGFKVVRAYLPDGGFQGCCYEIPGGHNCAFNGVADDSILSQSLIETKISHLDTFPYHIELEFTNNIDTAGVEGFPNGQNLFRIEYRMDIPTTGFFQAPLNIWKLENGQRAGLLNGVFKENEFMGQFNETWNPHENLWVLKSDYDPSGQLYQGTCYSRGLFRETSCFEATGTGVENFLFRRFGSNKKNPDEYDKSDTYYQI